MTPFFKSMRWRLQAWHGLLLLTVLAAFGLTAYYLALENRLRRLDHELQRQATVLVNSFMGRGRAGEKHGGRGGRDSFPDAAHRPDPASPAEDRPVPSALDPLIGEPPLFDGDSPVAFYYIIWGSDGNLLQQSTNAPVSVPNPDLQHSPAASLLRTRDHLREFVQNGPRGLRIMVGRDVTPEYAEVGRLAWLLSMAGAGVLVLGLFGGWWLTTRALRPIQAIGATAKKIAEGDLSQRIRDDNTGTELGQLTAVLNSTFARLEATFTQQIRFTSDAAHELRTPVTVLLTQTQTALNRDRPANEYREALEACQRAAQRMRRLIESLLDLARLDAGQETLPRSRFNLAQTAAECLELVRPLASARHIALQAELHPVLCFGVPERIAQVITNLLTNAIQYSREGETIRINARSEQKGACLTVIDTGPGILPGDLPHIFERFYRADKARSRATGQTGLGLAISKAIVEAHGGVLVVASTPGSGATFTLQLPLSEPQ